MVTSDGTLNNVTGAVEYLLQTGTTSDLSLTNAIERAQFSDLVWGTHLRLSNWRLIHLLTGNEKGTKEQVNTLTNSAKEVFRTLDSTLGSNTHFVGSRLTVTDVALYGVVKLYFNLVFNDAMTSKVIPNLHKWFTSVGSHDVVARHYGVSYICKQPLKFVDLSPVVPAAKVEKAQPVEEKKEEKQKHPCDLLPPSKVELEVFKRAFMNKNKEEELRKVFTEIEEGAYSFWHLVYDKLDDECKQYLPTKNMTNMFLQKADTARKYCLAGHGIYGEEGNYDIRGVWMVRGEEIKHVLADHDSFEYYKLRKLNPSTDADLIVSYLTSTEEGQTVDGQKVVYFAYYN